MHFLTQLKVNRIANFSVVTLFASLIVFCGIGASAAAIPNPLSWPKAWSMVYAKDSTGRLQAAPIPESVVKSENFEDYNLAQAELMHRPFALIGPEYMIHLQSSYDDSAPPIREVALGAQYYATVAEAMNAPTPNPASLTWINLIYSKDGLTPQELAAIRNDYRHNDIPKQKPRTRWFQIYDGHLTVGRTKGVTYGCGDVFQDGVTPEELACKENKTYLKCQLEQYKKYVNANVIFTPGACKSATVEPPAPTPIPPSTDTPSPVVPPETEPTPAPVPPTSEFPNQESILNTINANPHFRVTASRIWTDATPEAESFNMVVLVENESKWKIDSVVNNQLTKASNIFKTCGVSVNKVLLINFDATPEGLAVLSNEQPNPSLGPAEIPIGKAGLPTEIVSGFLIKTRTRERDVAYAFNRASVDRAKATGQDWSSLLSSYWISDKYITNNNDPQYQDSYSTIAHEITHIQGNVGHITEAPNLMTNSDKRRSKSGHLNTEQCSEIKKNLIR